MISKIITVIQARMGSTRLPGKSIMTLAGKPLIVRLHERVRMAKLAGEVLIATTTNAEDDTIVEICNKEKIEVFRGHPTDLLDRHFKAALKYNADAVVKIPSDCPLIDPAIIDKVIKHFILNQNDYDYVSNLHPATYPDGNDVEIFNFNSLKIAHEYAEKNFEREHTTPFFWENPERFRIGNIIWDYQEDYSMTHRMTVDYEEDYVFVKKIFDELYPKNPKFGLYEILALLERRPALKQINEKYAGVNWYSKHIKELKTINRNQTKII